MYPPIRLQLLLNQQVRAMLQAALERFAEKQPTFLSPGCADVWEKVLARMAAASEITRVRRTDSIVYQWAIAPQLSPVLGIPASTLAENLVDLLSQPLEPPPSEEGTEPWCDLRAAVWSDCRVTIYAHHLLQIAVGDRALSIWLQHVIKSPERTVEVISSVPHREGSLPCRELTPTEVFPLQAAHARCCSLLRRGQREGLIQIHPPQEEFLPQRIEWPHPLPWLKDRVQLRLTLPVERHLLALGVEILGDRHVSLHQMSVLSQSFQVFDSACRICGTAKGCDLEQAQARLGLILFIRYSLGHWLERHGVMPLSEL